MGHAEVEKVGQFAAVESQRQLGLVQDLFVQVKRQAGLRILQERAACRFAPRSLRAFSFGPHRDVQGRSKRQRVWRHLQGNGHQHTQAHKRESQYKFQAVQCVSHVAEWHKQFYRACGPHCRARLGAFRGEAHFSLGGQVF